jgi:hypothetical protein
MPMLGTNAGFLEYVGTVLKWLEMNGFLSFDETDIG